MNISARSVKKGDIIVLDGELKFVENVYEIKEHYAGVWFRFHEGPDRFFMYNKEIQLVSREEF